MDLPDVQITRRRAMGLGAALVALGSYPLLAGPTLDAKRPLPPKREKPMPHSASVFADLHAKVRPTRLFGNIELPLWTYHDDILPVVRVPKGARLQTHLRNDLPEHTSIHWHGIRLPNHMDGVPYVTQYPVQPGEDYIYDFTVPDTGLFPFHSHCNTVEQLGRGLAGALIVTGDETRPYDADLLCVIKDWRVGTNRMFEAFSDDEGASKAGTFGSVRSVNYAAVPELEAPAGGDVRLRLMNVDNSRVNQIGIEGAEAAVIATDGQAVSPFPFKTWRLGSAMRLDLCIRMPGVGQEVRIYDYFAPEPVLLATITAIGDRIQRSDFDPAPLIRADIAEPDMANAQFRRIEFSSTALPTPNIVQLENGETINFADGLCLSDKTFWAINKTTWPEDSHERLPAPILNLKKDRTYVFELVNGTPHMHPIHIHGHTFLYLKSNKRSLPKHFTDTVLLKPKERIHVAFKADNPGDWMFHCHIIEHAETGMMSILRVA